MNKFETGYGPGEEPPIDHPENFPDFIQPKEPDFTGLVRSLKPYENSEFDPAIGDAVNFAERIASDALAGKIVFCGVAGLPANGKSACLQQMDRVMFDPDPNISPRLVDISKKMRKQVIVYDHEWGAGYREVDQRVAGDYDADANIRAKKRVELDTVEQSFFGDLYKIYDLASENPQKEGVVQVVRFDLPLFTGLNIPVNAENAEKITRFRAQNPGIYHEIEQTEDGQLFFRVGMPRGDNALRRFVEHINQSPDATIYIAGLFAKQSVRDHTKLVREHIEKADTSEDKRRVLEQFGTTFDPEDFTDEEVALRIENMARTFQMKTVNQDFDRLTDFLVHQGEVSYGGAKGQKAMEMLQNSTRRERYRDELTGEAIHWVLKNHIGIEKDRGAVFSNEVVTNVALRKPNADVRYITSRDLDQITD